MDTDQGASYRRVLNGVLDGIRNGRFPPGGRLPSETALAEMYDVSRSTVTRAMERLRWVGLVAGPAGGISRVAPEPRRTRALDLIAEADRLRNEAEPDP